MKWLSISKYEGRGQGLEILNCLSTKNIYFWEIKTPKKIVHNPRKHLLRLASDSQKKTAGWRRQIFFNGKIPVMGFGSRIAPNCTSSDDAVTVPMHPRPRPFTLQLFLDFCAIFSPEWPLIFWIIMIHQVIWPSPGTLVSYLLWLPIVLTVLEKQIQLWTPLQNNFPRKIDLSFSLRDCRSWKGVGPTMSLPRSLAERLRRYLSATIYKGAEP